MTPTTHERAVISAVCPLFSYSTCCWEIYDNFSDVIFWEDGGEYSSERIFPVEESLLRRVNLLWEILHEEGFHSMI